MCIALIVTTYNRPDALAAVLEGCLGQSDINFEVIVADDGSTRAWTEHGRMRQFTGYPYLGGIK